jgi:hypothetical protein
MPSEMLRPRMPLTSSSTTAEVAMYSYTVNALHASDGSALWQQSANNSSAASVVVSSPACVSSPLLDVQTGTNVACARRQALRIWVQGPRTQSRRPKASAGNDALQRFSPPLCAPASDGRGHGGARF